ncbi:tetratricopeptide repeat protein [Paracrocinitomix mangrovi]|uniref:tetratricopeptide repeat protein n=1 Tax=Paracrocinitomix mangrovi TaxID=2862509 RepID=UPI001C8EACE2|nr:tetratricopeptide repeat protein [Paracrocinitomix mangrovi]UKN01311.1 tetratricopeptide repeat protein [Paracrocinitomix mangrovi]
MKYRIVFILLLAFTAPAFGQDEVKKKMYYGNEAYLNSDYERAIGFYLEAVDLAPLNFKANYNLANAYYRMNQADKAIEHISNVINLAPTSYDKSKAFHNMGNAYMQKQELDKAIDAYKSSLRLNPSDEETRYNLAYAQFLKSKEQQQNQQQNSNGNGGQNMGDNQNQNQDESQDNQDNQDEEGNDNQQNQDQNEGDNGDKESEGNKGDKPEQKDQDGSGQGMSPKLSKEQIENIMDAYYRKEKELQKKINQKRKVGTGQPQKKDW